MPQSQKRLEIRLSVNGRVHDLYVEPDAPLEEASQIISAQIPASFGQARAARDPRQIQLGIKFFF